MPVPPAPPVLQPEIAAERFVLRPLRRSDAGLIALYAGDERVARMTTSIPHPLPPGTIEAFIARAGEADRQDEVWVLDASAHGGAEIMGLISLERLDRNQSEIGYWIAPPYWNTGHASEAVRALLEANPYGSATMFASVFQDNPASARVLTNSGFEYIGDAEAFSVARNATVPTWTYLRRMS
ncbi:GNAT family N-acetyltransferase [Salipiger sp. P9]|uniref:GNAT family N-acetyltransferase n=1 Tax=Salipiger pentaromativorans TaxID=2943193 RepID=UPI0021581E11|nr:GNAT family N-acetyltransferase [Salipiger pentaromativorans]MCR8547287.1 GNAT family N-acetyltransferase [Salipiger pentaromativorans]